MRLPVEDRIYQAIISTIILLLSITAVFPLIYVLGNSFMGFAEWGQRGNLAVIPFNPTLEGYRKVLELGSTIGRSLGVTLFRTVIGTATSLCCTLIAGYAISREDLPGGKVLVTLLLIPILFGGGLIASFLTVQATGLYNNLWVFVIPSLISPWNALVFKQFFLNLPREIEESAYLDGASEQHMLLYIIIPMSMPVVAALGLFTAVGHWNSWFDSMVYIQDADKKPLMLYIRNLIVSNSLSVQQSLQEGQTNNLFELESMMSARSLRMCLSVIGVLPIMCVYPFLQKYFVKGMYVGAVKG